MSNVVVLRPEISVADALRALADDIEKSGEMPAFCTVVMKNDLYQIGEPKQEIASMRSIVEMQLAIQFLLDIYEDLP